MKVNNHLNIGHCPQYQQWAFGQGSCYYQPFRSRPVCRSSSVENVFTQYRPLAMCWYVDYTSSRCGHPVQNKPFCVGICSEFVEAGIHPSQFDQLGIIPECLAQKTHQIYINNLCYYCWDGDRSQDWLDPLDPRIVYMDDSRTPSFDSYNWYVDEVPLNPEVKFRDIEWNPDQKKLSEANADEEPVSPSTFLPDIPTYSSSLRNSIMTRAYRLSIFSKKGTPHTPLDDVVTADDSHPESQAQAEDLADIFPLPPNDKHVETTQAHIPFASTPSIISPRHAGRVLIIPHTASATTSHKPLKITSLSPHAPNIHISPHPVLALDATDPLIASTLQSGETARSTRTHLRTTRDSPAPVSQRARIVAETRVRLEEMGKNQSAVFKGGFRFRPAKIRRDRKGEIKEVEFVGEVVDDVARDRVG